jgi:6-phospho-3-hexuloisomerase
MSDNKFAPMMQEITSMLASVDEAEISRLRKEIADAKRVFVAGCGRSGCMVRAFANRLMHFGKPVFVVGETTTPAAAAGDLLLIGSGSGETESLVIHAKKAGVLGMRIALITIRPQSIIGSLAQAIVCIPASTPKDPNYAGSKSIQPGGTLFEQCLLLVLDRIIVDMMTEKGVSYDTMFKLHANLE